MKTAILMMAIGILGFTASAKKKSKTIVLVHGAWFDASGWASITPLLEAN